MVDLKSKILFYLFLVLFVLSVFAIYFKSTVSKDYEVYWLNYDEEEELSELE